MLTLDFSHIRLVCLIFRAGSKILLRQIRHNFLAWYQAMPDWSGTCQINIRWQPDRSGCCLIKIRHLPDRSGKCQIKIRQQPDPSGCCLIKIRQAWYQAKLSAWSILLRQIRRSGKQREFVRSLLCLLIFAGAEEEEEWHGVWEGEENGRCKMEGQQNYYNGYNKYTNGGYG